MAGWAVFTSKLVSRNPSSSGWSGKPRNANSMVGNKEWKGRAVWMDSLARATGKTSMWGWSGSTLLPNTLRMPGGDGYMAAASNPPWRQETGNACFQTKTKRMFQSLAKAPYTNGPLYLRATLTGGKLSICQVAVL